MTLPKTYFSSFVKYKRDKLQLSQQDLADKSGVGVRFIRELEAGKETLRMNKVNQVLALFGFTLVPARVGVDPYFVWLTMLNKVVLITYPSRLTQRGTLLNEILDQGKITAWSVAPDSPNQKADPIIVQHSDIESINIL